MDDVRIFGYLHSDVVHLDSELVPLHSDNVLNMFPFFHMGSSAADGECSRRKATCNKMYRLNFCARMILNMKMATVWVKVGHPEE